MPHVDSRAKQAAIALLRTASVVRRAYEALMNEHGITLQQFNVLRILRGANEPLPTMTIASRMIEPEPGITRLMGRLEVKELVSRERCPEDSRRVLCTVTQKGLAVLKELDDPVTTLDSELLGRMPDADLTVLIDLLQRVRNEAGVEP